LKVAKDKKTAARGFALSDPPAPGSPEFGRLLESITGSAVRCGNRVEVLRNGDQIFPAMVQSIRSAQATIDFSTYMYWAGGETIAAIGEALVERACAGVQISILLDAVGSAAKMDRELVERLREAGATVQWFRPPSWYTSCLFSLSDRRIVTQLEEHVRDDLELANGFDLDTWRDRPLRKRLVERAISPVRDGS